MSTECLDNQRCGLVTYSLTVLPPNSMHQATVELNARLGYESESWLAKKGISDGLTHAFDFSDQVVNSFDSYSFDSFTF